MKMGKPLYKSVYVFAGKREDGTYGIMRNRPTNTVDCFDTPRAALEELCNEVSSPIQIVIDIGLLLDPKIKRHNSKRYGSTLDASTRYGKEEWEK